MAKEIIFKAKDYKTRSDLENAVRNKIGLTPEPKLHRVEGTLEELQPLNLSRGCIYWGMQVVEIEPVPTKKKTVLGSKVDRGPRFESGINLSEDKIGKIKKTKKK